MGGPRVQRPTLWCHAAQTPANELGAPLSSPLTREMMVHFLWIPHYRKFRCVGGTTSSTMP
jgi:hypothetical protein